MTRALPRWLVALVAGVYLFLHLPTLLLIAFSFNDSKLAAGWTEFTLRWYRRLLERGDLLAALGTSLLVGVTATVVATVLGTLLAAGIGRLDRRRERPLEVAASLPLVTPEIVTGVSLLVLFALTGMPLGLTTVLLAHITLALPFVVVVVLARLRSVDRSLEEAALVLGADEPAAFRQVTLPLLRPGILAGALLAFTVSFDDFVITSLVSGPGATTLPLVVYSMVRRTIEPSVNAISTVVLIATGLLIWLAHRLIRARAA